MQSDLISTKTLNFGFITNKIAEIYIKDFKTKGIVMRINNNEIFISIGNNEYFKKNAQISINISYEGCILEFSTKIKYYDDGVLALFVPRKVRKIQQREHVRVDCNIKCILEKYTTGNIKNISAGGAFIILDNECTNLVKQSYLKLCFNIDNNDLRLNIEIIEQHQRNIRIKFCNLSQEEIDILEKYSLSIDALNFREKYHDR